MNKAKLIESMAKSTKQPKVVCKEMLEAILSIIGGALKQGKKVALTGFGTFTVLKRKSRTGINPVTRQKMTIAAKKVPKFQPGKALKASIK